MKGNNESAKLKRTSLLCDENLLNAVHAFNVFMNKSSNFRNLLLMAIERWRMIIVGCIFIFQSVIQMMGFRSLGDDEEIEFECKVSDKGLEATMVQGVDGNTCRGSHRRPISKKKFRRLR